MTRSTKKLIIGGAAIAVLAYVGFSALGSSSIEYTNISRAEQLGKTVRSLEHGSRKMVRLMIRPVISFGLLSKTIMANRCR